MMWLLIACAEPISNAFLLEDQEFLDALPQPGQHQVGVEGDSAPAAETPLQQGAARINATIDELLSWVETVEALPPSERSADGRSWGPYPGEEDREWRLDIERVEGGRFQWAFGLRGADDAWVSFFWGEYVAGYEPSVGRGSFTFDYVALAAVTGEAAELDQLSVEYDHTAGRQILGEILDEDDMIRFWYGEDEAEAHFQFRMPLNVEGTDEAQETYTVLSRWRLTGGGRSDASAVGGDLGALEAIQVECWDDSGEIVYSALAWGAYAESSGDEAACAFDGPEPADPWLGE